MGFFKRGAVINQKVERIKDRRGNDHRQENGRAHGCRLGDREIRGNPDLNDCNLLKRRGAAKPCRENAGVGGGD